MNELRTWEDLFEALRSAGLARTAEFIAEWQDEWIPDSPGEPHLLPDIADREED